MSSRLRFKEAQYIYLLILREHINSDENIFKIGKTKFIEKRLNGYPKGSSFIYFRYCTNCDFCEKMLIKIFKSKFKLREDFGSEYFEGNYEEMIKIINNFLDNESNNYIESINTETIIKKQANELKLSKIDYEKKNLQYKISQLENKIKKEADKKQEEQEKHYKEQHKKKIKNVLDELILVKFIKITTSRMDGNLITTKDMLLKYLNFNNDDYLDEIYPQNKHTNQIKYEWYFSKEQLNKRIKDNKLYDKLYEIMTKKYGELCFCGKIEYWKGVICLNSISLERLEYYKDPIAAFITERIRKNPDSKHPIKKTSLLEEFKMWFQQEPGSKKPPKGEELYEYMNKKFGACTKQGWVGTEIIIDAAEDEEELIW